MLSVKHLNYRERNKIKNTVSSDPSKQPLLTVWWVSFQTFLCRTNTHYLFYRNGIMLNILLQLFYLMTVHIF